MTLSSSVVTIHGFFKEFEKFSNYFTNGIIVINSDDAKYSYPDNFILKIPDVMRQFNEIKSMHDKVASVYIHTKLVEVINRFENLYRNVLHIKIHSSGPNMYIANFKNQEDEEIANQIFGVGLHSGFKYLDLHLLLAIIEITNLENECAVCLEHKKIINSRCANEHHFCISCLKTLIKNDSPCPLCRTELMLD